jgi:glutaryl-CoA dehydrogenase
VCLQAKGEAVTSDQIPGADLLRLDDELTDGEREIKQRVKGFVDTRIKPTIAQWYEQAVFPVELVSEFAGLGLLGMHLHGYGCAGRSAVEYGIAMAELEAGDSGIRTFVSVQGSLAMSAIHKFGSEEQKNHWLPAMAKGEVIGCFGLTEAGAGSDPGGMATTAAIDGDHWVINGTKRWIGLASIAQIAIVWANTNKGIRGFIVPTGTPGFSATTIEPKMSMRASIQCDVTLDNVRIPLDHQLPGAEGLKAPFSCLNEARYGIVWGAMGAARDSFEVALDYATTRVQFDKPIAATQLVQQKLVEMALEIQKGQLLALRLGRLKDAGELDHRMISVGKLNNARAAIEVARTAREILGGNGVTSAYSPLRHSNNLESVRTYEGTDHIHTLILGQWITGHQAFR